MIYCGESNADINCTSCHGKDGKPSDHTDDKPQSSESDPTDEGGERGRPLLLFVFQSKQQSPESIKMDSVRQRPAR